MSGAAVNAATLLVLTSIPSWVIHVAAGIPGGALFTACWSLWTKRRSARLLLVRSGWK